MDCFPNFANRKRWFPFPPDAPDDAGTPIQLWRLARVAQLCLVFLILDGNRVPLTLKLARYTACAMRGWLAALRCVPRGGMWNRRKNQ